MDTHNFILTEEAEGRKTEIAASLALCLAEDIFVPVCLVDMDQTKYMFQARDFSSLLEKGHVHMAVDPELWDSPLMPQGITSLPRDDSICCVFDAGGDAMGIAMLGQFTGLTAEKGTNYYYVISPCRALPGGMEDTLESLNAVLILARIPAEDLKFITSPFMGEYMTPELIMEYVKHLEAELSKAGLELHGLAVSEQFFGEIGKLTGLPILELNTFVGKSYVRVRRSMWRFIGRSPYES